MKHLEAMTGRLPALYRHGPLLQGLLTQPALQQMIVDEDLARIQQAHFFELTRDFQEVAWLADLLGLKPEPESGLREFRSYVAAFRDALREHGTTTLPTIRAFVSDHLTRFQRKMGIMAVPNPQTWRDDLEGDGYPALVEHSLQRKIITFPGEEAGSPLQPFSVENKGLDQTTLSIILRADDDSFEATPCVVNSTTGQGVVFQGIIKPGQRLWIKAEGPDALSAQLEHQDVTHRFASFSNWEPGQPLTAESWDDTPKPLALQVGMNQLSFFPLAQFDQPGLDRYLLAMPDTKLRQGRFNQGIFDQALFHQERRVRIQVTWVEKKRATFVVKLPMAAMLRDNTLSAEDADHARTRLVVSLDHGVKRLKAAGVDAAVEPKHHREGQRQMDFLRMIMPIRLQDGGVIGKTGSVKHGASFDKTLFNDSLMA